MSKFTIALPAEMHYKIITVIVVLAFLFFGGMKMMSPDQVVQNFQSWGYPTGFHYIVGILEILGALGLLLVPYSRKAAIFLAVMMVGALGTHVMYPPLIAGVQSLVLLILCAILIIRK